MSEAENSPKNQANSHENNQAKLSSQSVRLTQTVLKGGCAAKVAAAELRSILAEVRFPKAHPELKVDGGLFDDAAIYQISPELSLVQTLDFFTPIVDSPKLFGRIAAANALSDVYAMGGKPKTAMAILAFPLAQFENQIIVDVLQGASDKISEAGANFVGGHSIDDDTLKFGLSVTGFVNPQHVWTNAGARAGDQLLLTKALGTGAITAGLKRGQWEESEIQETLESMAQLNNVPDFLNEKEQMAVHAATDITGFGFAGHAMQMAMASQVHMQISISKLPRFEKLFAALQSGFLTKAHRTNREYTNEKIVIRGASPMEELMIFDPQTSGGLLLSVAPEHAQNILLKLKKTFPFTELVGEVVGPAHPLVEFQSTQAK